MIESGFVVRVVSVKYLLRDFQGDGESCGGADLERLVGRVEQTAKQPEYVIQFVIQPKNKDDPRLAKFIDIYQHSPVDFKKAMDAGVDGIFTNRASELLKFYQRPSTQSASQLLENNGY